MARNAVHSALFLISSLVSVAALFILLGAEFIAGVQILVYVGGVMVLFLFVIMLVNVGAEEEGRNAIFNRTPQVAAALLFLALLGGALVIYVIPQGYRGLQKRDEAKLKQAGRRKETQDQDLAAERHRRESAGPRRPSASGIVCTRTLRCRLKLPACSCWWRSLAR